MITGHIIRQRLNLCDSHIVADTINYLEAKFFFKTDDWDGLDKWAHFANDSAVYDIRLTDNCIRKEDHLNLSAGMWKVYLHGNEFRGGEVVQRITTDEVVLYVIPTGILDGEPFPTVPPSAGEQIIASAAAAEAGAKSAADAAGRAAESAKDSADLAKKSAEIVGDAEQIVQDALRDAKESGEFDGITPHIGASGNWFVGETDTGIRAQGKDGAKGDPGDDYILTAEDKQEIAGLIPSGGNVGNVLILVGGASLENLRIEFVAPPAGVSVDAAYELIGRGLFDVAVQTYSDDGNDLTGVGLLRGMPVGDAVGAIGEFWSNGNVSLVNVTLDFFAMTAYAETMYTSSGGGGVVIIAQDADGSYTCSHTPAEIAEMAQTGAVVAGVLEDEVVMTMPLYGVAAEIAIFAASVVEDGETGTVYFGVTPYEVVKMEKRHRIAPMTGASANGNGEPGTVPAPSAGQQDAVLHGDGTWRKVDGGGSSVAIDTTLTQEGKAADAKVTGEKINNLSEAIAGKVDKPVFFDGNLQIGDENISSGVSWNYADGLPENNGFVFTGTEGTAVLHDNGVLLSPGAEYKPPVLTAGVATFECVFSIPSFASYQYGFLVQLTNGTSGIRVSCYLNQLRFNQNTTNNSTVANLETDMEYTLRIEWNETTGATVYLNGATVVTGGKTVYELTENVIRQTHSGTTLLKSVTYEFESGGVIHTINGANIAQKITDKGGYFASDTVEGALQEIGAELTGVAALLGNGVFE